MLVKFHDPHPGFAGASIRFPEPLRQVANELDGMTGTIEDAIALLQEAGDKLVKKKHFGKCKVTNVESYEYIMVSLHEGSGDENKYPVHTFKAIEYDKGAEPQEGAAGPEPH
jgi:hypothetical protein